MASATEELNFELKFKQPYNDYYIGQCRSNIYISPLGDSLDVCFQFYCVLNLGPPECWFSDHMAVWEIASSWVTL